MKLPTTPGSVVQSDSLLMLTRFGNWVSDGVFTVTHEELAAEPFVVLYDAGDAEAVALAAEAKFDGHLKGIFSRVIDVFEEADEEDRADDILPDVLDAMRVIQTYTATDTRSAV